MDETVYHIKFLAYKDEQSPFTWFMRSSTICIWRSLKFNISISLKARDSGAKLSHPSLIFLVVLRMTSMSWF